MCIAQSTFPLTAGPTRRSFMSSALFLHPTLCPPTVSVAWQSTLVPGFLLISALMSDAGLVHSQMRGCNGGSTIGLGFRGFVSAVAPATCLR